MSIEDIYIKSFRDELEKTGGLVSEQLSVFNPINLLGVLPAAVAAAITPTKTKKEMAEQQKKKWSNILVPGAGYYRSMKRIGYMRRSVDDQSKKEPGMVASVLGGVLNPMPQLNLPAAIAAAITPTKTKKEMSEQQKQTWINFVPGVGSYNQWKALGYSDKMLKEEVKKQMKKKG